MPYLTPQAYVNMSKFRYNSADLGTPHEHWATLNKPHNAMWHYADCGPEHSIHIVYLVSEGLLCIKCHYDYWPMDAYMHVTILSERQVIRVDAIACKASNKWPELNLDNCPDGQGGQAFFKDCLDYALSFNDDLMRMATKNMFGDGWTTTYSPSMTLLSPEEVQHYEQVVHDRIPVHSSRGCCGYYDM